MKMMILVLSAMVSLNAFADLKPMPNTGREGDVAATASSVFNVTRFDIGTLAFKVTEMDTALNGDLSTTTILFVGKGEVGGAAGYDAAFLITPIEGEDFLAARKIKVHGKTIVFQLTNLDGKITTRKYQYDEASMTLKTVK